MSLLLSLTILVQEPAPAAATSEAVPWVVVEDFDFDTQWGSGSVWNPELARYEDGTYVACFARAGHRSLGPETSVYRSRDRGRTWALVANLEQTLNPSLIVNGTALYLLGEGPSDQGERSRVRIRRSMDQGDTWTSETLGDKNYQTLSISAVEHESRLWAPLVRTDRSSRLSYVTIASAPVGSDLLSAEPWRWSEEVQLPARGGWNWSCMLSTGGAAPVLVVRSRGSIGAAVDPSPDGRTLVPRVDFPEWTSCQHAFGPRLKRDPKTGMYFVVRGSKSVAATSQHKWVELASSTDLVDWELSSILLGAAGSNPPRFAECDWVIEDGDLLVLQAVSGGYGIESLPGMDPGQVVIFYRVPKFRDRKPDDAPLWGPALPK